MTDDTDGINQEVMTPWGTSGIFPECVLIYDKHEIQAAVIRRSSFLQLIQIN